MSWRMFTFNTDIDAKISDWTEIKDVVNKFSVEQTLGDENYIQSGDINLNHRSPFPWTDDPVISYWLAVYCNEILMDVFKIEKIYDKKSDKFSNQYSSRLWSMQKVMIEDFKKIYAVSGFGISAALVDVTLLKSKDPADAWQSGDHKAGYSLGDLLNSASGIPWLRYHVDNIYHDFSKIGDASVVVIARGASIDVSDPPGAEAYNFTIYNVLFWDLFEMAMISRHAFSDVRPKIIQISGEDVLAADIYIRPRTKPASYSPTTPTWLDRNFELHKSKLDGLRIASSYMKSSGSTPNFEQTDGDIEGDNVYEREIAIANPSTMVEDNDVFRWYNGYLVAENEYDVCYELVGFKYPYDYFTWGNLVVYYNQMLDFGDVYSGKIRYNGERPGDFVYAGTDVIQITKLNISANNKRKIPIASIEGFVVAAP